MGATQQQKTRGGEFLRYWPAWLVGALFLIFLISILVVGVVTNHQLKTWRRDCDECVVTEYGLQADLRHALGDDRSPFGSVATLDDFFMAPTFHKLNVIIEHLCDSSECTVTEPQTCKQQLCQLLAQAVEYADEGSGFVALKAQQNTTDSGTHMIVSKHDPSKGVWRFHGTFSANLEGRRHSCSGCGYQPDLVFVYRMIPVSDLIICFSPRTVDSIVARCLPVFTRVCYDAATGMAGDARMVRFCNYLMDSTVSP